MDMIEMTHYFNVYTQIDHSLRITISFDNTEDQEILTLRQLIAIEALNENWDFELKPLYIRSLKALLYDLEKGDIE
jgi:hypothetical protein